MVGIVWFAFLFYYDVTTIKNLQAPNIRTLVKNNKVFHGVAIFIFIICIVYLFLPYEKIDIHNLDFLPGTFGTIGVMAFGIFTAFVIFCYLIKYRKSCDKDVRFSVIIMFVIIFLILAFQIRFQWVSLIPLGYALQMLFLYFHVENPDLVTITELQALKEDIKQGIPYYELEQKYNISASFISSINNGVYFQNDKETYPLFKYYKSDKDYDELIDLLLNSTYSYTKIAEMLNISQSTVKKINAGTLRHGLYPTYPIRTKSANEQRADKIKELLLTTKLSNLQIGEMVGASEETVRRIKLGKVFKDDKLSYPLSNL